MQANDGKSSSAQAIVLGMAVIALIGMIGTIGLLRQVDQMGPKVGDIVAFDPAYLLPRDVDARITAVTADSLAGEPCVLDVRTMHAGGGSVVIESSQSRLRYRIHWAGQRSSDDGADCGKSADLLLSQDDMQTLAMAAGGYGIMVRRQR